MLFGIDKNGDFDIHDHIWRSVPELDKIYRDKKYGPKYIEWLMRMADYESPYAELPYEKREEICNNDTFKRKTNAKVKHKIIKEAYDKLRSLQDNENKLYSQLETYATLIKKVQSTISSCGSDPQELIEMQKLATGMENINKLIGVVKDEIRRQRQKEAAQKKGGGTASFIEKQGMLESKIRKKYNG